MSAATRDLHYGGSPVYGNLAYDLDREIRERELRHAGEKRREDVRSAPRVRSLSNVQVREKQHVSWLAVVGFSAVVVLSILVLMSYVQLTMLSSSVVGMEKQLSALQTQNITLTAQYEKMYDLSTVKEAAEADGMAKPTSSQIYYIDLSNGDSAVVYQDKDASVLSRLLTSLNHGFYAVVEYFD